MGFFAGFCNQAFDTFCAAQCPRAGAAASGDFLQGIPADGFVGELVGSRIQFVERVAKLTLEELCFRLALCGMRVEAVYGDYQLQPFDARTSPRLMLIARKPSRLSGRAGGARASGGCG